MPSTISRLVRSRAFGIAARLVLTFVFWSEGLAGVFDFPFKVAEMRGVGLPAPEFMAVAVTLVQLGGSFLVIIDRYAWLGAGALGVFLAKTIPIAHPFWTFPEPKRTLEFFTVLEHVSLIGGMMVAAALGADRAPARGNVARAS